MSDIHPAIEGAARKFEISPNIVEQYNALFLKCGDWFAPSNQDGDEFRLASVLHHIGLLDCMRSCRNQSGSFTGYHVTFKQAKGLIEAAP